MATLIPCNLSHAEELIEIGKATFYETFVDDNTAEDMQHYLDSAFNFPQIESELKDSNSLFFLLKEGNENVGYLKVNFGNAQKELQDEEAIELERIYVRQKFTGSGYGKILFEKVRSLAKEKSLKFIWLGVWEYNHRALKFYKKLGFQPFGKHVFRVGSDDQIDILMRLDVG